MPIYTQKEVDKARSEYLDAQVEAVEVFINRALCKGYDHCTVPVAENKDPAAGEVWKDVCAVVMHNMEQAFQGVTMVERPAGLEMTKHGATSELYITWGKRIDAERENHQGKATVH